MKKTSEEKWEKRTESTIKILDYLWDEFPLLVAQKIASMIPESVLNRIGIEKVDPTHKETSIEIEKCVKNARLEMDDTVQSAFLLKENVPSKELQSIDIKKIRIGNNIDFNQGNIFLYKDNNPL